MHALDSGVGNGRLTSVQRGISMQVSVENTTALERRLSITVPVERIETAVNKRLQQTAQKAKIAGFRPGKVPMSEIKRRFGADARQEAVGDVIQASFYEAVVEQKLNPAGSPSIEPKSLEAGKDLEYVAVFEVFPEFEVAGFEGIAIERLSAEVADADLDNMLEVLRKQNTRFEVAERAAQNEDQLNIDFVGKVDGEAFAGGSAKGTQLVLGSNRMIPGFEDGLVGAKAGEERVLNLTFPADYQNLDLAGKTAEFTVTVNTVSAPKFARTWSGSCVRRSNPRSRTRSWTVCWPPTRSKCRRPCCPTKWIVCACRPFSSSAATSSLTNCRPSCSKNKPSAASCW